MRGKGDRRIIDGQVMGPTWIGNRKKNNKLLCICKTNHPSGLPTIVDMVFDHYMVQSGPAFSDLLAEIGLRSVLVGWFGWHSVMCLTKTTKIFKRRLQIESQKYIRVIAIGVGLVHRINENPPYPLMLKVKLVEGHTSAQNTCNSAAQFYSTRGIVWHFINIVKVK